MQSSQQSRIADFVQSQFPGQFLIPVASFAKLTGESYGGCRNRISAGTFQLKVIQRGTRNYVAILDVIDHLARLADGNEAPAPTPVDQAEEQEEKAGRRSKYGEAAKARAAAARTARAAKRQHAQSEVA